MNYWIYTRGRYQTFIASLRCYTEKDHNRILDQNSLYRWVCNVFVLFQHTAYQQLWVGFGIYLTLDILVYPWSNQKFNNVSMPSSFGTQYQLFLQRVGHQLSTYVVLQYDRSTCLLVNELTFFKSIHTRGKSNRQHVCDLTCTKYIIQNKHE